MLMNQSYMKQQDLFVDQMFVELILTRIKNVRTYRKQFGSIVVEYENNEITVSQHGKDPSSTFNYCLNYLKVREWTAH